MELAERGQGNVLRKDTSLPGEPRLVSWEVD